ncbi:MAG: CapA family protein [Oscillospiraceae bacterium]
MKKRVLSVLLAALLLTSCSKVESKQSEPVSEASDSSSQSVSDVSSDSSAAASSTSSEPTEEAVPPEPEFTSVSIVCAGDNLIHSNIFKQAAARAGGEGYDFSFPYQYVRHYIEEADLAILNQETIITDMFEPSNYPCFCTPEAMGHQVIELGFDAISIGNNHVLDKGESGLLATLDFWGTNYPDVPVYGAYKSEEDMNNLRTLTVNGIKFGFLSYMEHTNGLSLPADSECELVYLSELELIEQQIKAAKEECDCVIISPHFGIETTNVVSDNQYYLAQKFADWGADIIIGTQPHTIQTMEYLDKADGGKAFVFYCLGNFLSSQDYVYCMVEMLGRITVTKNNTTGEITLSDANAVPLINHYDYGFADVRIYPFSEYTEELAASHGCEGASMEFFKYLIAENIPEEFLSE